MSGCNHNCSSCSENCSERKESLKVNANELSNVKKVIGIVSGKGGVGKSLVTSLLAVLLKQKGYQTAVLDGDITGASITKVFGVDGMEIRGINENTMLPVSSKTGIRIMSINLFLEEPTNPVVWRGPVLAGALKQFWTDVAWGDVDYMFVDMPPGTGDIPLRAFQSLPLDGIVIVTTPQELVGDIVTKAFKMANMMNIPVLGLVENMSYFVCPKCEEKHYIYGNGSTKEIAKNFNVDVVSELPITPKYAKLCDNGEIENLDDELLTEVVEKLENLLK